MPQKSEHTVHILEGQATLFRRPTTPHWHVRYKVHGKWERTSTRCTDLADARQRATQLVSEAWFKERHGMPVINKRFKSVARLAHRVIFRHSLIMLVAMVIRACSSVFSNAVVASGDPTPVIMSRSGICR